MGLKFFRKKNAKKMRKKNAKKMQKKITHRTILDK